MPPQQVRDWPEELSTVMSQNNPSWIPMDYTSVLPFSGFFSYTQPSAASAYCWNQLDAVGWLSFEHAGKINPRSDFPKPHNAGRFH